MQNTIPAYDLQRLDRAFIERLGANARESVAAVADGAWLAVAGAPAGAVISGFITTNPAAKTVTVTRGVAGRALLSLRDDDGLVTRGHLVGDPVSTSTGDIVTSLTIDLSSFSNGTYGIWIAALQQDVDNDAFITWDPATNTEASAVFPSRRVVTWTMTAAIVSPGPEWLQIATAVVSASPTLVMTDTRPMFFEGTAPFGLETAWGSGANDRTANRGNDDVVVDSIQRFAAAVRRQLQDIIGGTGSRRWYSDPGAGLSGKVSKDGDELAGQFVINSVWVWENVADSGLRWEGAKATPFGHADVTTGAVPLTIWNLDNAVGAAGIGAHATIDLQVNAAPAGFRIDSWAKAANQPVMDLHAYRSGTLAGTPAMRIDDAALSTAWGTDLIPNESGRQVGTNAVAWNALVAANVRADKVISYLRQFAPTSQTDLITSHQLGRPVAWIRFTTRNTNGLCAEVSGGNHFNVVSVTRIAQGIYTIQLDQPVLTGSCPLVTVSDQGTLGLHPTVTQTAGAFFELRILAHTAAGTVTLVPSDAITEVYFAIAGGPQTVIGTPLTEF